MSSETMVTRPGGGSRRLPVPSPAAPRRRILRRLLVFLATLVVVAAAAAGFFFLAQYADEGWEPRLEESLAAVALLMAVIVAGYLLGRSTGKTAVPRVRSTGRRGRADPTEQTRTEANFPEWARGDRLALRVHAIREPEIRKILPCTVHQFEGENAYLTDCSAIAQAIDRELIFIAVTLTNTGDRPLRFELERFLLSDRDGATYDPVDVRPEWGYAPFLLSRGGWIPPGKAREGWLTFDGRLSFRAADALAYVDGDQAVTVRFDGRHDTERMRAA